MWNSVWSTAACFLNWLNWSLTGLSVFQLFPPVRPWPCQTVTPLMEFSPSPLLWNRRAPSLPLSDRQLHLHLHQTAPPTMPTGCKVRQSTCPPLHGLFTAVLLHLLLLQHTTHPPPPHLTHPPTVSLLLLVLSHKQFDFTADFSLYFTVFWSFTNSFLKINIWWNSWIKPVNSDLILF